MTRTPPRPDLLSALPDLVAARIALALPGLRTCRGMAGRLDLDTLKAQGIAAPAVLVSQLGARQGERKGGPHQLYDVDMSAFVVTKDAMGLPRDIAAVNICQALLSLIPEAAWNEPGLGAAKTVAERSLVSAASDKLAVSLWAVTWTQPLALQGWPAAAAMPIELYVAPDLGLSEGEPELIGGAP